MGLILYTCGKQDSLRGLGHPCAKAGATLKDAGHSYKLEVVPGYRLLPWTRRGKRAHVRALSGQENVPILVLDSGDVITGSGSISKWAKANPAS